jgi:hypothetical protein
MLINRLLPLILSFGHLVFLEIIFISPKLLFVFLVLLALFDFFVVRQFIIASKRQERWWYFIILPLVFTVSLTVFTTLLPAKWLIHLIFIINSIFNYFYFSVIYNYLIIPTKYKKNSLENTSSYGNFLAFYFLASSIYGLQIFLNVEIWRLMIVLLVASLFIVYEVFWANRVDNNARFFYMLILSFMIVEFAWAISFMSLNFYILGLILAIFYYTIIGLTRFYLLKTLNRQTIKAYLVLGICSVVLVLFTANWISYN